MKISDTSSISFSILKTNKSCVSCPYENLQLVVIESPLFIQHWDWIKSTFNIWWSTTGSEFLKTISSNLERWKKANFSVNSKRYSKYHHSYHTSDIWFYILLTVKIKPVLNYTILREAFKKKKSVDFFHTSRTIPPSPHPPPPHP